MDVSGLSAELRCVLDDSVQHVKFRPDEVLFMKGQPSAWLFVVSEGMVKMCAHSAEGCEQIVGFSGPHGLLVGLQSLVQDRYAYSAIAASKVVACRISHRILMQRVREDGDLAVRLVHAMSAQLALSRSLMEVLGHKCAGAKIAAFLMLITPRSKNGNGSFPLPFSRLEIANLLGLSEETVCRLMASMKREGAIHTPRGRLEVLDWHRLHEIADGKTKVDLRH